MKALYNNHIIENEITLKIYNRAFQFGDGLFETIGVKNSKPRYLTYHLQRLKKGAEILNFNLPTAITKQLEALLLSLLESNELKDATMKLMVWRSGDSDQKGYTPTSTESEFLIICKPGSFTSSFIDKVGIAESIHFYYSPLSSIKTLNALPYILASQEKKRKNLDELIVLNNEGYVCECTSSNIFWIKNKSFATPPISSGCLEGVSRRALIQHLATEGIKVKEELITPDDLQSADSIFCTNSAGIKVFQKLNKTKLDTTITETLWFQSFINN